MADGILIKPPQLREAAAALRQSAKTVQASINEVDEQIKALDKSRFEGVSADTIRAKYARLRDKFYSFKPFVDRLAGQMELIAAEFTKSDNQSSNS